MRDERGSIEFEANLANLLMHLRYLWRDGKIDVVDHFLFTRRARRARTIDDLRQIVKELAEKEKASTRENCLAR